MFKEPVKNRRHLARLLHFQIFLERKKLQGGEQKLACKERPEVAFYPEGGDAEKDKGQPDKEACHAVEKGLHGFSKAVQDACEGGIHIQEGAHESQDLQITSGFFLVKDKFAKGRAKKQKEYKTEKAKQQAVTHGAVDGSGDRALLVQRLGFGNRRQQHYGDGAGECRGKQYKRK